jgi:hypothetical protein
MPPLFFAHFNCSETIAALVDEAILHDGFIPASNPSDRGVASICQSVPFRFLLRLPRASGGPVPLSRPV